MPADVNFAAWIGIPLAMVSGATAEYALSLSIPLSFLGVAAVYATVTINCLFVHKQDRLIERGQLEQAEKIPVVGQVTNFVLRFFPHFVGELLLAPSLSPKWLRQFQNPLVQFLQLFGSMLPLVGFAILLNYVVKKNTDLIYYLVGFALIAVS